MQCMLETHIDSLENLPYIENIDAQNALFSFSEVSFNKVREIINNLKNRSSPDTYGLNIKIIKSL